MGRTELGTCQWSLCLAVGAMADLKRKFAGPGGIRDIEGFIYA
jgi:hypothetical protein